MRPTVLLSEEIEAYARAHSDAEPALLAELAQETRRRSDRARMMVGPLEGAFLRLLAASLGARRVLEIGTFTGYSALWLAAALPEDGRLLTLDVDADTTEIARSFWARSPHGRKIESRLGPALDTLRTLEGPFDLVFIDADKESYPAYWDACVPLLRPGGLLLADNVLWKGKVLAPEQARDLAICAFNEKAAADPRVERVVVPLRDGVLLARRKA